MRRRIMLSSRMTNHRVQQQSGKEERSVHNIVDGFVIPHVLSVVCMEGVGEDVWWQVVEGSFMLWKRLCVLEGRYKVCSVCTR